MNPDHEHHTGNCSAGGAKARTLLVNRPAECARWQLHPHSALRRPLVRADRLLPGSEPMQRGGACRNAVERLVQGFDQAPVKGKWQLQDGREPA